MLKFLVPLIVLCAACGKAPLPVPEPAYFSLSWVYDSLTMVSDYDSTNIQVSDPLSVEESSGAVAAYDSAAMAWMINDSGNPASLFLVQTSDGSVLQELALEGVQNVDWEDVAGYQDTLGQRWLYIADIGDNLGLRSKVQVYRFQEPDLSALPLDGTQMAWIPQQLDTLELTYPGGGRDAEALFIDPNDGELYVISKRETRNVLCQFTPDNPSPSLQPLGEFTLYLCTAADAVALENTDSTAIIVRNYDHLLLWTKHFSEPLVTAMQRVPRRISYAENELQGECFWMTTRGDVFTASEEKGGELGRITRYLK